MNKTDLINQLAQRLDGDKKAAQSAVEGLIDLVQREVQRGESVSISGFGVFEKRARAARTARNPRTGQAVKVKKTTVPAFRPGKYFKDVIAGTVKMPKTTGKPTSARAAAAAAKTPTAAAAPTKAPAAPRGRASTKSADPATSTTATAAKPATRTRASATKSSEAAREAKTTRATTAKTSAAKAPGTRGPAAKAAPAAKAPASRTAAKKK